MNWMALLVMMSVPDSPPTAIEPINNEGMRIAAQIKIGMDHKQVAKIIGHQRLDSTNFTLPSTLVYCECYSESGIVIWYSEGRVSSVHWTYGDSKASNRDPKERQR